MKTFTQLKNLATSLSTNTSSTNDTLLGQLINDRQRYILQKYFDNERTVTITTVGGFTLTVTSAPALGATSATLSSAWTYPSCTQLVTFSDSSQRSVTFTYNSTAITWSNALTGTKFLLSTTVAAAATSATLASAWAYSTVSQLAQFSDGEQKTVTFTANSTTITWSGGLSAAVSAYIYTSVATTSITTLGVQNYSIPADVSKIKNNTISVGQLKYQPTPIESIQDWDMVNFLPYTSDIPNYFFIYNGTLRIFPIPSTTGNIITFNYKGRIADMSYADYTTGTIANASGMTVGSTAITGTGTSWTVYPQNVDILSQNLYFRADVSTGGDGIWYPILKFTSATTLVLALPVISAPSVTVATTYTIGQMPLVQEDFHDMLVFGALKIYYSSIVSDTEKFKEYSALEKERFDLLEDYAGTKQVNVDLGSSPQAVNPNLFIYSN